jgi:hypothetical protein
MHNVRTWIRAYLQALTKPSPETPTNTFSGKWSWATCVNRFNGVRRQQLSDEDGPPLVWRAQITVGMSHELAARYSSDDAGFLLRGRWNQGNP